MNAGYGAYWFCVVVLVTHANRAVQLVILQQSIGAVCYILSVNRKCFTYVFKVVPKALLH